jgi:chromosome segregation ATPase
MTPEERFTKIENMLSAMMERQAVHSGQLEENARQVEKNSAGIRDLIVVSRTLVDAQQKTNQQIEALHRDIQELREEGKAIDARLTVLIDIADRLIRRNGNAG